MRTMRMRQLTTFAGDMGFFLLALFTLVAGWWTVSMVLDAVKVGR